MRGAGACRSERRLASIHHFMTRLVGLKEAHGAFEPKDLLDACPLFAEPVTQVRTTAESRGVPPLHAITPRSQRVSSSDDRGRDAQTDPQYPHCDWVGCPRPPGDNRPPADGSAHTTRRSSRHGIQGKDAPLDQVRGQPWFEGADLMLFLLPIAVPEDDARAHLITTELLDRMGLRTGGTKGFAIDGQMRVLALALRRVYTARFVSTPALRV